ncbi:Hypothetical protein I596_928 [Dokdonella koreensis DS-123]|uniref:DUF11 domain-containing protein n=2 Tax=Dokdonella TaxID=323413 RepID=A0A160DRV4_9GAMM|nr:Hypothetical protein I596_928 [Dokdonella koreensis DS-123]
MLERLSASIRRGRLFAASALGLAIAMAASPVAAEGTRTLHPAGAAGNRGIMDVSDSTNFANVARGRQFLYVYARAGEYILLGSRNRGNGGDIFVYDPRPFGAPGDETIPASADFACSSQTGGLIASRDEELAGPNSADGSATVANGFTPCWYVAPVTGIYGVRFTGATSGGQTNTASIATPPILTGNLVSAWDVTVRASADALADIDGRLFTYAWTVYLQSNGRTLHNSLYYVSTDGYRYRQTFRGLDPNRAAFYANATGFVDTNGGPLYRDMRGSNAAVTAGPSVSAGITAQRPQYPIFFSDIAPGGAQAAEVNRVLTALAIPLVPAVPQLTSPTFVGSVGGNTSTVSSGGVFTFTTQNTLTYEIVVSRDGVDFDPANVSNRVLTGTALTGNHSVLWNGLDNNGNPFPAGDYQFRIVGRNGEIHFPMIDVEGNSRGGPTLTKLNGSQDSTVYYDDRGYRAANGTLIGALNGHLCGAGSAILQPVPTYSLVGVDSADADFNGTGNYYRSWGGSNDSNADCTNNATQYFATAKGLDLWALERSPEFQEPIEIVEPAAGVDVGTMVTVTSTVLPTETAYGSFVFSNAGDATATGVTYGVTLGNPADPATCPAAINFTMVPGGVTTTYNPAPACTITFAGMPTSLAPGQALNFNFSYVVAVSNPGPIPVTTAIAAANETPGAPAPNTAAALTVVARPVVTVVKDSSPPSGTQVDVGDTITYTLSATIANAPLTGTLTLDDMLGAGLAFDSVTGSHPSFTCSGALTCTLPPGTAIGTYTVTYTATVDGSASGSVANNVVPSGGGGENPPSCAPCRVEHPLVPPPSYAFCPASGDPAQVFSIANGVRIYGYTPPSATPDTLLPLLPATMANNLNALMLDRVNDRLLMIERSSASESTLWAYDAANGGWYVAAGPFASPDFPRGGFNATGTGYLLSGAASPEVWTVVAQPSPSFAYTVTRIGNMTYDQTPTNLTSGDIAFDGGGRAWLAVGQDLWQLDLGTLVAVRQTRPLLDGAPSAINWAGIAFASNGTLILANNNSPSAYYQYDPATGVITHLVDTTADASRDLASCAFPVQAVPELSVVKTLDQVNGAAPGPFVYPGDVLRYAITISNTGGAVATLYPGDVVETLPANTTFVATGNDFSCSGTTCPNTNAVNVVAGGSVTLHFVVQLDTPLPTAQISNAVAIPGEVDCSVAPNDCTETTPVGPRVTMNKSLQSGGPVAQPGGSLVYAITLTNLTGVPASIPAGAIGETVPLSTTHSGGDSFACSAPAAGSACSNAALVTVPANGNVVLTFAVAVANPIPAGVLLIQNTAVPPPDVACPSCSVTTPTAPDVTLVKALTAESGAQPGVAEPGETLTYTITLSNSGGTAFTNYDFVENVPANATLAAVTGAGVTVGCTLPLTGAAACPVTVATVPANGTTTVSILFAVANPIQGGTASITNLVDGGDTTCPQPGNACSVTTPTAPNVTLVKALTAESGSQAGVAEPGETLTYTITLANSGGTAFVNYDFVENVPANVTLASVTGTGVTTGCALPLAGAAACPVTVATVPANGTTTVSVVFTVDDPIPSGVASITNLVNGGDTTCPQPGNACSVTTPTAPSVTLVKALTGESGTEAGVAEPGETLTYTITLTNAGGTAFTDYDFVENVPANVTLASVTGTGVATGCALPLAGAATCNVTVASVPANASTTVTVAFTVDTPIPAGIASITNLVNGGDTTCTQPGNTCSVTTPTAPSVTLVKALTGESGSQAGVAEPGETLTYTITLANTGGADFTDYDFAENVPADATLTAVTGVGVTACALPVTGAGTCNVTVASVPAGGSTTVSVVFTVADPLPAGVTSIVNLVSGGDTTCSQSGNTCSVTTPTQGRVSVAKAVLDANANGVAEPGEALTWTITLTNAGGTAVTGYGLTDPLDANTSFVSASNGGTHAGGTVTWTGLTVPAQVGTTPGTLVLTVVTTVNAPIPEGVRLIANLAYETGGVPPDCAAVPAPANCASIPTTANVSVAKALSGESITADGVAEPGERLTYTITLRNHGGTAATDVLVNETVPLHTVFVSGAPAWSCAAGSPGGTACDTTINVPAADTAGTPGVATLTFTVQVVDPLPPGVQQIANAVAIDDGTPPDCAANPTHPQCVVTPTINLSLIKSVESVTPTGPGTFWVAYRIDLANTGGSPVSYTLTDTPDFTPAGVAVTGNGIAATSSGTLNPALPGGAFVVVNGTPVQISASAVTLAVGATHSYTVRIPIAVSPGSLANAACTGAPGGGLYNQASVTGSFVRESSTCAPVSTEQPLIRLVKTVRLGVDANGDHYGNVGDVLHYTFAISNPGTVALSAIDLIDPRVTDLRCDATTAYGEPMRVLRGDELFAGLFEELLGGALVPGDSILCSATYTITAQDVLNRRIVNTATTHGAAPDGQVVTSTSTAIYSNIR